jgi:amino acid adenylation domain-containing protein
MEGPAMESQSGHDWDRTIASISERIRVQAESRPDHLAIVADESVLGYGELVNQAADIANSIACRRDAKATVIPIAGKRSPEAVVAMLGIMEARAAYLGLDEALPSARIDFMLEDSGASLVAGRRRNHPLFERYAASRSIAVILEDEKTAGGRRRFGGRVHPDQPSYLIYTSGSTGVPKGVLGTQGGLANLVDWHLRYFGTKPEDRVSQIASLSFDASLYEIWPALCAGATVYLVPERCRISCVAVAGFITEHGITQAFLPTPLAENLFEWMETYAGRAWSRTAALRHLTVAGSQLRKFAPSACRFQVTNAYGPTESTVASTCGTVPSRAREARDYPSIGSAIDGVEVYVLDHELAAAEPGQEGELWIAGLGLAQGYNNRPAATAERFLPDPFATDGRRMYRTGDRARWLPNRQLEFVGRIDNQVKIRGARVELGEIEAALRKLPGIRDAVVLVREVGGSQQVVAYCEGSPDLQPMALRDALSRQLPVYMVPSRFVLMRVLPLTASSKVDRQNLPLPTFGREQLGTEYVAPRDSFERRLAAIFAAVLGLEELGIEDNFFFLGGDSLLATRCVNQIGTQLGISVDLSVIFENPSIKQLSACVRDGHRRAARRRPGVEHRRDGAPLAIQQEQVWFLSQLDDESNAYNAAASLRFRGDLDLPALEATLQAIVERHEIYRTVFPQRDGAPYQSIQPAWLVRIPIVSAEHANSGRQQTELKALLVEESRVCFDLTRLPLVRWKLVRLSPKDHVLLHVEHHIVHDGWSFNLFLRELAELYSVFSRGIPAKLPPPAWQFADYAAWQREWLGSKEAARQLRYWRERLADGTPHLMLPYDYPSARSRRPPSATLHYVLPEDLVASLRQLAVRSGTTLFAVCLSVFKVLLHRYTGSEVLTVGTGLSNRTRVEFEDVLGMFVNMVALRTQINGDATFEHVLGSVRKTLLDALAHQELPFEHVVAAVNPKRDLHQNPVYQVSFSFHDSPLPRLHLPNLVIDVDEGTPLGSAKFDLNVIAIPRTQRRITDRIPHQEAGLKFIWEYNSDLFDESTMCRMFRHYEHLVRSVVAAPCSKISQLCLIDAAEQRQLIQQGRGSAEGERQRSILAQIQEHAWSAPDRDALVCGSDRITYQELWRRAEGLAWRLRRSGAGEGRTVGLLCERSANAIVGMLAVLQTGAAYLYLDPVFPTARLLYMLQDAQVSQLLVDSSERGELFGALPIAIMDEVDTGAERTRGKATNVHPQAAAYLIYTSGSTGQPKAVVVPHRGISNLVAWHVRRFALVPGDRVAQVAALSFDASAWEIWSALCGGATLLLPPDAVRTDPAALMTYLAEHGITVAFVPTPTAESLLGGLPENVPRPHALRVLLVGGDRLSCFAPTTDTFELVNAYGPTENSVVSTCSVVQHKAADGPAHPPIGRPIDGVSAYVLDDELRPVPDGVPGELHLAGRGLAREYRGRPALTGERFIPDPFSPCFGARLYRTGDQVRWLPDGQLEFIGRLDGQLKIRGIRVDPGEIEAVLRNHPSLVDAVVRARPRASGEPELAAWIVPARTTKKRALRTYLRERLPVDLIPSRFIEVAELPRTGSGKIDDGALQVLDNLERSSSMVAPLRTDVEKLLGELWSTVLGVEVLDPNADFFELGGHSMNLVRLRAALHKRFGLDVALHELYQRSELHEQATYIDRCRGQDLNSRAGIVPFMHRAHLSYAQQRLWFLQQLDPESSAYNIPLCIRIDGDIDAPRLQRSVARLVDMHEMLRTRFLAANGRPTQVVEPSGPVLAAIDCSSHADPDCAVRQLMEAQAHTPFALHERPPVQFNLYKLSAGQHALFINLHHILADRSSIGVLFQDLSALYADGCFGEAHLSSTPRARYLDHAQRQRDAIASGRMRKHIEFWHAQLSTAPRQVNLIIAGSRPQTRSFTGAELSVHASPELRAKVELLARRKNVTPFVALLAGFVTLLQRYSGQDEVVIGTMATGRLHADWEQVVGLFAETVVLRTEFHGNPTFADMLGRVRKVVVDALANQAAPFECVVEALGGTRDTGSNPVFQIIFNYDSDELSAPSLPGVQTRLLTVEHRVAKFDLAMTVMPEGFGWRVALRYSAGLFKHDDMARMADHYTALMADAADRADDIPCRRLRLTAPEEADRIDRWSRGECLPLTDGLVPSQVQEQSRRNPGNKALVDPELEMTYGELDACANSVAAFLARRGIGLDSIVAIRSARNVRSVVAMLGIMRCGAGYLALDDSDPPERVRRILNGARVRAVFTCGTDDGTGIPPNALRICLQRDWSAMLAEKPLLILPSLCTTGAAYAISTSGSTGAPKRIVVSHGALCNLVAWQRKSLALTPADGCLQLMAPGFDVSVLEIWPTLCAGATLHLPPANLEFDPELLLRYVARHRATIVHLATPIGETLLAWIERSPNAIPPSLRILAVGGSQLRQFAPGGGLRLINLYGPAEACVVATTSVVETRPCASGPVPTIGRPIANCRVYVLDEFLDPVAVGLPGEIYIGGHGVGRGYVGQVAATAERFIPDPFDYLAGARMYRTGDRGRWLADGNLQYLGRDDTQVKIRGVRVELAEIESVLLQHPAVHDAVILVDSQERLVAYVAADERDAGTEERLRSHLEARVSKIMIPAKFVLMAKLPLNRNGKIDRHAHPIPAWTERPRTGGSAEPGQGGDRAR